jgi:hypothetical protein
MPARTRRFVAIALWLSAWGGSGLRAEAPGLEGQQAETWLHFRQIEDPTVEHLRPLGVSADLPPGWYLVWMEGPWAMTPFSHLVGYLVTVHPEMPLPLVPAGKVTVESYLQEQPGLELHLLHLGEYRAAGFRRWEISIHRSTMALGDGVLMPAGPCLAGLWHKKSQRYLALSRPFVVPAGKVIAAPLQAPTATAHLLARVAREPIPRLPEDDAVTLGLRVGVSDHLRPPDVVVETASHVYGAWYGVTEERTELRADSAHFYVRTPLALARGQIAVAREMLRAKATLDVYPTLLTELLEGSALTLRHLPLGDEVARQPITPEDSRYRFEDLVAGVYEVVLSTPLGPFTRRVELEEGERDVLFLEPQLLTLRGRVERGGEPLATQLRWFTSAGDAAATVESNEEGAYEVVLLEPARGIEIELPGEPRPAPFIDFFLPPIRTDRELDFQIPDRAFRVAVVEARTRRPIFGASVIVRNRFDAAGQTDQGEARQRVVAQGAETDRDGVAHLAPPRPGTVTLRAVAAGYRPMDRELELQVLPDDREQEAEIALEPLGEKVDVTLRLADGRVAAGAEALLVPAGAEPRHGVTARADERGVLQLPRERGLLLARHPQAAFLVAPWEPPVDRDQLDLSLPAQGDPLQVRTVGDRGEGVPSTELEIWLDGVRLSGEALSFLTGTAPRTDEHGLWVAPGVPAGSVAVLAWRPAARGEALVGRLEDRAVPVPYPWLSVIPVPVAR